MLVFVIFAPLLAGIAGALISSRLKSRTLSVTMTVLSVVVLGASMAVALAPYLEVRWMFLHLPGYRVPFGFAAGTLPGWMAMLTALVNVLAQFYSLGYFARDSRQGYFQSVLLAFTGSMLLTVFASNLFTQFVGWEFMGIGSYLLVGYFRTQDNARYAASKAMLVTRIGDVFFLLAVIWSVSHGQTTITEINHHGAPFVAWALVVAVAAKSAQGPNISWLLDAMAGPTPASALIHAATMVAAGPYLLIRYFPVLSHSPGVLPALIIIGGATAVAAGVGAVGSQEAKRLLAFSTVSQLGMMVLAVGLGFPQVAWTLLVAHAFYKALLFFVTGVASHRAQSGLLSRLKATLGGFEFSVLFMVGALGVSGLPPTGGFLAKEALFHISQGSLFHMILDYTLSFVGGAYAARLVKSLAGKSRAPLAPISAWMLMPAVLLSLLVILNFIWHPWVTLPAISLLSAWPSILLVVSGGVAGILWNKPFRVFSGGLFTVSWKILYGLERMMMTIDSALSEGVWATRLAAGWMTGLVHLGGSGRARRYVLISGAALALFIIWNIRL